MPGPPIAVNLRSVGAGLRGGIPRYVDEVVSRIDGLEHVAPPRRFASGPLGHAWEQIVLPRRLGSDRLLWSPGNFGPLRHRKQVVSIYDVAPLDHPEWFGPRYAQAFGRVVPTLAHRCLHVITISEFSKQRIVEAIGVPADNVTVAEPGVDVMFRPDASVERTNDILIVAGPDPRKNLGRVIDAFERVSAAEPERRLVVVTGARASGVFPSSETPTHPRIEFVADPGDRELVRLYQSAGVVVSVPLYEGYGLPAAEALACGAPLIVSDIDAHAHALPHAAAVVDPTDTDAISDALRASPAFEPTSTWTRTSWSDTADAVAAALERHR